MASDSNIHKFTAEDIERYQKGLLSSKEKHEIEKAALEDPFLADAMEGFNGSGVNISADIVELKERLSEKTEEAKVIPFKMPNRSSFNWWKIAAILILVAGAGTLLYYVSFNNKPAGIAQEKNNTPLVQQPTAQDKVAAPAIADSAQAKKSNSSGLIEVDSVHYRVTDHAVASGEPRPDLNSKASGKAIESQSKSLRSDSITTAGISAPIADEKTPAVALSQKEESGKKDKVATINKPVAGENRDGYSANVLRETEYKKRASETAPGALYQRDAKAKIFRGKVTDLSNNPLPFANITNTRDDIGTYSDVQGNFSLVSPDSVLNVQVKSVGFSNRFLQLQNGPGNLVTLQEDRSLTARILDTVKRNTNRPKDGYMVLEEPEPVDGWVNYDVYLTNNLKAPDRLKTKISGGGEVEVSFEVSKDGEPTNIKIEKSLCDACDREAIRLIREGPKWKRKARKGRTVVKIGF